MAALDMSTHPQFAPYHAKGIYGEKLGWGSRPILLLIDVCAAYWTNGSPLDLSHDPEGAASPESMKRLVAAARRGGVPIIWAQVRYNHARMQDAGVQGKKSKTIQAWQAGDTRGLDAWMPGLEAAAEDLVILKRNPSAFFGTSLTTQLHLLNANCIVLCGVSTSGCVRATAADALCAGYRTMVVGAACGDRSPVIQQQTLFDIDCNFGDVVSEDDALQHLSQGWES